jgi:phosphate transport system permease protein
VSTVTRADSAIPAESAPDPLRHRRPLGDRVFAIVALASGLLVLVILVLIAISTSQQASSWFSSQGWRIFSTNWDPPKSFGALPFIYGTAVTAVIAVVIAVPVSVGIALLLTEVVPHRWARPIVYVVDLLAVVPSVVWGLWGIMVFAPWALHIYSSIASGVNGIPVLGFFFGGQNISGASYFTAGLILAFMITPIVTSLTREVIATTPDIDKQGAYALGATRWEMIRGVVWPHSQGGTVGAVLLGLGRAMGETIAAALVIGSSPYITSHLFSPGYNLPAVIANQFGESTGVFRSALIGMGVLLFAFTIIVNVIARGVVERSARRARGA